MSEQTLEQNAEHVSVAACEGEVLDKAVEFPLGIPGFPDARRFVFIRQPDQQPFAWMRSVEDHSLAFAVVEAYHLVPDFSFDIDDRDLETIGNPAPEHCALFFIVKIDTSGERIRLMANCNAPLLVNVQGKKGRQVVLPSSGSPVTVFEV